MVNRKVSTGCWTYNFAQFVKSFIQRVFSEKLEPMPIGKFISWICVELKGSTLRQTWQDLQTKNLSFLSSQTKSSFLKWKQCLCTGWPKCKGQPCASRDSKCSIRPIFELSLGIWPSGQQFLQCTGSLENRMFQFGTSNFRKDNSSKWHCVDAHSPNTLRVETRNWIEWKRFHYRKRVEVGEIHLYSCTLSMEATNKLLLSHKSGMIVLHAIWTKTSS